jgi:O-antigen/teichoic acid export membrane protein
MRRLKAITNNIKYNAVSQITTFIINFLLLPFIVFHTGKELYGAYILVVTFTGYLGLMDFGVGGATVKYIAEFASKDDNKKVNDVISASLTFFTIIGILAAILLFIFSFYFDVVFKVDAHNKIIIKQLFEIAAVASLLIWPGRTFDYALQGFQRYDRFAINNILFTLLTGVSAYFIFANNFGIVCYLGVSSIFTILKYLSAYLIVNKTILKQHVSFPNFNKEVFKIIFNFSFYLFLSSLASILIFNVDSIIVGTFVSVAAVTVYNVGFNMQQGFRMINSLIGGPLFPAYVEMEGRKEYENQKKLLFKGTKYMALIFVPMVIITIVFAKPFIKFWMGEGFLKSVIPAQILIVFWFFNCISEIGSGMLTAKGLVKKIFEIIFLTAIFNFTLSLILVRYLGIIGVALGTTIPMILINFLLTLRLVCKTFKITAREYFYNTIKASLTIFMLAVVLSILICKLFPPDKLWIAIFEMGAVYAITILTSYHYFFPVKDKMEIRAIMGFEA